MLFLAQMCWRCYFAGHVHSSGNSVELHLLRVQGEDSNRVPKLLYRCSILEWLPIILKTSYYFVFIAPLILLYWMFTILQALQNWTTRPIVSGHLVTVGHSHTEKIIDQKCSHWSATSRSLIKAQTFPHHSSIQRSHFEQKSSFYYY